MPLPESSTPQPDDLNPLTDVLYLAHGKVGRITPKHPEVNPRELLIVATAAIHLLGDVLYGRQKKHLLKHQPAWAECLMGEIANELNLEPETLLAVINGFFNKDYALQYLNTEGFRSWAAKEGLDELHPFLDRGLNEIVLYYASKGFTEPLPREDRPSRQSGNG